VRRARYKAKTSTTVQNKFNKNLSFSSTAVETLRAAGKIKMRRVAGALLLPAIFIGPYSLHVGRGRSAKIDLSKRVI
jgi:hypothetical protein